MPEITRKVRITKILTFTTDERVFSDLENRFGMITGRNIKGMSFSRWTATVLFDSKRMSRVKPRPFSFSITESVKACSN